MEQPCSAGGLSGTDLEHILSQSIRAALAPLLEQNRALSESHKVMQSRVEQLAQQRVTLLCLSLHSHRVVCAQEHVETARPRPPPVRGDDHS
jgi:hypothetical protein